jgi:hypothetical protein
MDEVVLQSIIGTDKRNPYLHVCRRREGDQLDIFYGAQLLETVINNKDHISYRSTVGRLYNAGVNRAALSKVFDVDRKTLQRWGKALLMPDAESSIRALRSRSEPRKLTVDVRRFAEVRFGHIYARNRATYGSQIRREIYETFGVRLSPESLRPIFKACRQRVRSGKDSGGEGSGIESQGERGSDGEEHSENNGADAGSVDDDGAGPRSVSKSL